jgi:hypothetical protein
MIKYILWVVVVLVGWAAPSRPQETVVRNWHSPETACLLLADVPGMQTRGYKSYEVKGYGCSSPYKEIGKGTLFSIPNNLAYYVNGNQQTVNELKLVLNVNTLRDAEVSHAALAVASGLLTKRALNGDLSDEVLAALLAGRSGKWKTGSNRIEVYRDDWATANGGYEIHFTIR